MVAGASRRAWCVYLLRCRDGSLYAGATNDLAARVARHGAGRGARYTRSRLPVVLVWSRPARGRGGALRQEAALKRLSRAEKLALVAGADASPPRGAGPKPAGGAGAKPPLRASPKPARGEALIFSTSARSRRPRR